MIEGMSDCSGYPGNEFCRCCLDEEEESIYHSPEEKADCNFSAYIVFGKFGERSTEPTRTFSKLGSFGNVK